MILKYQTHIYEQIRYFHALSNFKQLKILKSPIEVYVKILGPLSKTD